MGFNVDDLKKSNFITQKDVDPPKLVTITGSQEANMAQEGADPDYQWTLLFKELDKPFVVNSTNGQLIEAITGSKNSDDWIGHQIVLYVDPAVSFRGKVTGGVRVRAPQQQPVQTKEEQAAQEVVDSLDDSPAPALRENPKKKYAGQDDVPF